MLSPGARSQQRGRGACAPYTGSFHRHLQATSGEERGARRAGLIGPECSGCSQAARPGGPALAQACSRDGRLLPLGALVLSDGGPSLPTGGTGHFQLQLAASVSASGSGRWLGSSCPSPVGASCSHSWEGPAPTTCIIAMGFFSSALSLSLFFFFFFFFWSFRATPVPYGSFQTRGRIGATVASLHHSHSNARSKSHLQPIPQLTPTPDP